ncbi:MAG TPA: carboxylate--amine ligase [Actinobacteria bacterium]|nr:carboxylate--amine ligase [Actinomycetota bacterium]
MDHLRRLSRPQLRAPRALLAWEGWNDACDAASGSAAYLLGSLERPEPFAVIEPEEFYDFQVHRPQVKIDDGGTRRLTWPMTRAYALPAGNHDLVLVTGEEPNLRWKTYTRTLAGLLTDHDVEMVVTLGAFVGQVAHTRPVPIVGVATDPALVEHYGLLASSYEGPTGIVGVMLEACREVGIPALSLWAATPHYLAANPNPKAMAALLGVARRVLELDLDLTEMEQMASDFEARVDEAMAENEEFVEYVRRLEDVGTKIDPSRSAQMINEIEDFLRGRN